MTTPSDQARSAAAEWMSGYERGAKDAAEIASTYSHTSTHKGDLGDCVLAKLNLLPKDKIRPNKAEIIERETRVGEAVEIIHELLSFGLHSDEPATLLEVRSSDERWSQQKREEFAAILKARAFLSAMTKP